MNSQIRQQAQKVKDQRAFVEHERQKMRNGMLNPRVFESYEMRLQEQEEYLCTLVLEFLESEPS